jgi:hypothetical protein
MESRSGCTALERPARRTGDFRETQTDAQGKFKLSDPEEGAGFRQLIARAPDGRLGWHDLRDRLSDSDMSIELLPVGEARGRLTDPQGQALQKARIQLRTFSVGSGQGFRQLSLPKALWKYFEAGLHADGSFVIGGVPLGAKIYALTSDPGHGEVNIGWNQGSPGEFCFEKSGRLRIRFAGAADVKKLAGLRLSLFVSGKKFAPESPGFVHSSREVVANGAATLEIDRVLPGQGELTFQSGQEVPYLVATLPKFTVKVGEVSEVTVPLMPAAHVRGRVVDQKAKKGVVAVRVIISSQDRDGQYHSSFLTTGADGTFAAFVHPGRLSAFLNEPPAGYVDALGRGRAGKPVDTPANSERTLPDIALEPVVPVDGIAVDEAGKPLAGVTVRSAASEPSIAETNPTTDAKGRFVLKTLAAGDVTALRARSGQAVTDGAVPLDTAQQKGPVKLFLSEKWACRVQGRVVDGTGKPVAGASLRVIWYYRGTGRFAASSFGAPLETLRTGADGGFRTTALWPGDDYHVEIAAEGYSKAQSAVFHGKAGHAHDAGTITLVGIGGIARGVVVDSSGKPLSGVTVFNQGDAPGPLTMSTGADGHFQLTGLFEGRCYVFARKPGYRFTMIQVETGMPEARITLLRDDEPPPIAEQPVRTKEYVASLHKLTAHVIDKGLAIPEAATGGYKSFIFECLVQTDLPRAQKWLAANPPAAGSRYVRVLRLAEAEHLAGSDVDETLTLLAALDKSHACEALLKLGGRFAKTDRARSLRFVEEAVVQARTMDLPKRAEGLARAGELVIRLGQRAAGRKLLTEAAALAEKLGSDGSQPHYRAQVACCLAGEDLPRARALLKPLLGTESANGWLSYMARRLAATDVKAALALVDEMTADRSNVRSETRLRIACSLAERDPAEAVRVAKGITDVRYRAEALGHVAGIVARRDRKLAWSLIDRSLAIYLDRPEEFRSWSNFGGRGIFAAWTAGQAQRVGYPDMASVIARVLACRDSDLDAFSPIRRLENLVRNAKVLVLIDPAVSRNMLDRIASRKELLGSGYSGFQTQDWLLARCLADPVQAPAWIDEAIAKMDQRKDPMAFYRSGVIQLAQVLTAAPARRLRVLMGLNSALSFPDEE